MGESFDFENLKIGNTRSRAGRSQVHKVLWIKIGRARAISKIACVEKENLETGPASKRTTGCGGLSLGDGDTTVLLVYLILKPGDSSSRSCRIIIAFIWLRRR